MGLVLHMSSQGKTMGCLGSMQHDAIVFIGTGNCFERVQRRTAKVDLRSH